MEFQPFIVTCVTCGSRLRVGRQQLVGTIGQCPKCNSMVQLNRPAASSPEAVALGDRAVDSNALTEDSIAQGDIGGPARASSAPSPQPAAPPVVGPDDDPADQPSQHEETDVGGAPPPDWHQHKSSRPRRIALSVAVASAALISVVILVVTLRRQSPEVTQRKAVEASSSADETPAGGADADVEQASSDEQQESGQPAAATTDPDAESDHQSAGDPSESDPETDPGNGAADPPSNAEMNDTPAGDTATDSGQPPAELLGENPLLPSNPLADIFTEGEPGPSDSPSGDADISQLTELPDDLREILGDLANIDRPQFTDAAAPPPTIDEFQVDRAADVPVNLENVVDAPDPINMRQALGLSIAMQAADPDGYPLANLLSLLGQLSGVPIEIEWVSFDLVGVPLERRVPLPSGWLTIEEILTSVSGAIDAEFETGTQSIRFRPTPERLQASIAELVDLKDLGEDSGSAVTLVRSLLGQSDGDASRVAIPESVGQKQIAALVCESVRRIRDVPGKLDGSVFGRWCGPSGDMVAAWPQLRDGVSGRPQLQPSSVASAIRDTARVNGAVCFINWQDARRGGLMPSEGVMPHRGKDVTAADALSAILRPAKLQVRVVDRGHWWIGSQASFDRFPTVVWFDSESDDDRLQRKIAAILASASTADRPAGAVGRDDSSNRVIAIMPRFLLRQVPRLLQQQ